MSLPEKLKTETHTQHQLLESHPCLQLLVSEALTTQAYAHVLQVFYGYFAAFEQQLNVFPELLQFLPDWPARRKAAALLADLEQLSGKQNQPLPLYAGSALPQNLAQAFGCLYVLEGSTLGGKFIAQQVSKTLGAEAGNALGFFRGYGPETGQYWKTFREALTNFNYLADAGAVIVRSAQNTFQQFHYWLSIHEAEHCPTT